MPANAPVPPQNLDAEESVLGAMMLAEGAVGACSEILAAGDFYRPGHGRIYQAAVDLYGAGQPVDSITMVDELDKRGQLEDVGGRPRIHELASLVPATANAGHYARIVKDTAQLRGLIRVGSEVAALGWDRPGETADLIDQAQVLLYELSMSKARNDLQDMNAALHEVFARITELYESGGDITGVSSGLKDLDHVTLGFQPEELTVLGARPSIGKSALALCVAANIAVKARRPVALFTLEMSRATVTQRLLSMQARVPLQKIRTGRLAADDWARLTPAADAVSKAPLYVDDSAQPTMPEIRAKVRRLASREPLALVIVDYLGLLADVAAAKDSSEKTVQTGRATQLAKALARDVQVPVLLLSQLSREVEHRNDKRPILSDLRQSGEIEQHADVVMFLYRDGYYHEQTDEPGVAELHVAKSRNGPTGTVKLAWQDQLAKFGDLQL